MVGKTGCGWAILCLGLAVHARAGDLRGTVRNSSSVPIASVWVDAYNSANARVDSGLTDTNGLYAITNLPSATYYLLTDASVGNYVDEWYSNVVAESIEIPTNATALILGTGAINNLDFALAAGGSYTLIDDYGHHPAEILATVERLSDVQ